MKRLNFFRTVRRVPLGYHFGPTPTVRSIVMYWVISVKAGSGALEHRYAAVGLRLSAEATKVYPARTNSVGRENALRHGSDE